MVSDLTSSQLFSVLVLDIKVDWGQALLFKSHVFYTITFELLASGQKMRHHHISLFKTNQLMPNSAQKANFKILYPTQFGPEVSSGQSLTYWV